MGPLPLLCYTPVVTGLFRTTKQLVKRARSFGCRNAFP